MNRIAGKTVLITGATAGIGEACARRFAAEGASLVLWARREDRLARLADELEAEHGKHVHVKVVDVRDRAAVIEAAGPILGDDALPHILINNAGLASGLDFTHEADIDDWDVMIDTNIKGLLYVTRALLPRMIELNRGHIINLGSAASHMAYPKGNVYAATKAAVLSLTQGFNLDVAGTAIRVCSVDPGLVETDFSKVRFHGDEERAKKVYQGLQPLTADDVADTIFYVANRPEHVNIQDVLMMPTAQRNIYVIDRK